MTIMRWIWIDKFTEFTPRTSATAVKCVSLAEEHLHDLYPAFPIVPNSLIIEITGTDDKIDGLLELLRP